MKKNILYFTAALTLFIINCNAQLVKKLYEYPLGVQAYTFRNHFPNGVEKTLDIIKSMGFTELEGGPQKGQSPEEFKKMCDDRGISIPSTGCSFEELQKDPQTVADRAKTLGAKYVMCAWIPHKGNEFTLEDTKKAVEVFNTAGKVFKDNGLIFCYHDHGYEFRKHEKGTYMDYLIANTKPEYVSFEMDVLWTIHGGGAESPEKLLKKYGNRWKLMHVKDLKIGIVGDKSGHEPAENDVVLGTGQANWKKILKLAKKAGIEHYFIEDESEKELINVPKSIAFLKEL
jgi:sugar phosphate isomerase/epimerase